jgi:hypothetical protein
VQALQAAGTRLPEGWAARGRWLALLVGVTLAGPALAQPVGPRPLRLTDLSPANVFSLVTEYARVGGDNGLALPVGIDLRVAEEVAFTAEMPFGYAGPAGTVAQPVMGNLGLGARGSRYVPVGTDGGLRLGAALQGRVPTAPGVDAGESTARAVLLRPVSFYRSERWSPGAAAVRLDLGIAFDRAPFAVAAEIGGTGVLPIDARPARLALHYGLLGSVRAFKALWLMVEVTGADTALGRPEDPAGHLLALSVGLRAELGRFSPAAHVAFPLAGSLGGHTPIVFAIEMASF